MYREHLYREFNIPCMHAAKRRYSTKIKSVKINLSKGISAKIYTLEIYPLDGIIIAS